MFEGTADSDGAARPGVIRYTLKRMLSGRAGSWTARILIAVPGIAVLFVGVGRSPTPTGKFWHDLGLPFLLLAATLPLWRRTGRRSLEPTRWREALHRTLWRTSGLLLFAAAGCLIAGRYFAMHGDLSAAGPVQTFGGFTVLAALVPPFLEPVLWPLFPGGLRRVERTARLMEELNNSARVAEVLGRASVQGRAPAGRRPGLLWGSAAPKYRLAKDFDVDQGASGRPKPFVEHLRGLPPSGQTRTILTHQTFRSGVQVTWNGRRLVVTSRITGRSAAYPVISMAERDPGREPANRGWLPLRRHRPVVAELVSFDGRNRTVRRNASGYGDQRRMTRLILADERGRRILTISPFDCNWSQAIALAKSAGLTYNYYRVDCEAENVDKIVRLMFPWRPGSRRFSGSR